MDQQGIEVSNLPLLPVIGRRGSDRHSFIKARIEAPEKGGHAISCSDGRSDGGSISTAGCVRRIRNYHSKVSVQRKGFLRENAGKAVRRSKERCGGIQQVISGGSRTWGQSLLYKKSVTGKWGIGLCRAPM